MDRTDKKIQKVMNEMAYDVAIPGNHEFDYGMDRFLELASQAKFKYISCNFNKNGELVFDPYTIVEACGKKIAFVGVTTPEMLGINNPIRTSVEKKLGEIDEMLDTKVAVTDVDLTINDPVEKDTSGNPIRMVRRAETNLGDLIADAMRIYTGADIGIMNGGGVRAGISKGDITNRDILSVFPWNNAVCLIEVTGQQILDALEWGARGVPDENGAFLQVSGMSYEIDTNVPDPCIVSEDSMLTGFKGERRVKNVMVGDEPLDPAKTYIIAGQNYSMLKHGDGQTAFDGATIISSEICIDNVAVTEFIVNELGGTIGEEYADPYGQGRITIIE